MGLGLSINWPSYEQRWQLDENETDSSPASWVTQIDQHDPQDPLKTWPITHVTHDLWVAAKIG